jgi:16S rRNA (uracil1498-N3)-methyltransferase
MPKRVRPPHRQTTQSNTYRFFVNATAFQGREVAIEDDELAHQIGAVLRLRPGERVLLLDNSGWQYVVILDSVERRRVAGTIERKELAGGEPRTKVTLYVALMRAERFEWVLQKGTELGVCAFVPLICERSVIGEAEMVSERRLERWGRIVREAAEQSRRGKLPRLAPALAFPAACEQAAQRGPAILLWEGGGVVPLRQALRRDTGLIRATLLPDQPDRQAAKPGTQAGDSMFSVALFSGPEGGITAGEFETAQRYGMIPVTLGPRTLRAETAPLVAASAIFYEMGDLE